ncbi:uncharacterized protein LOC128740767 [Sabethes cyaneus]|uniref:uncharacterized protein LOC128740767 n=1 Tax=Sabethes cyaneus TaxID=53552 RepID=UPI00237DF7BB|nr:uncharacterized protein LOC128740767 [Sabethes cyaneus]
MTSLTIDASLDTSGAMATLQQIGLELFTPFNALFTAIQTASSAACCDPIAAVLTALTTAEGTINTAMIAAQPLQAILKATTYTSIVTSLQTMLDSTSAAADAFTNLQTLLLEVASTSPAYTASTVTKVITWNIGSSVATPLKTLIGGVTSATAIGTAIVKDIKTAATIVAKTNTAINKGVTALVKPWTAFTKSVNDATASITKTSTSSIASISTSYNAVLIKASNYNGGDMSDLTTFLATFPVVSQTTLTTVLTGATTALNAIMDALTDQEAIIIPAIVDATKTMISTALTSQSSFAVTCLTKYSAILQGNSVSMSRLSGCVSSESSSVSMMVSTVSQELASIVSAFSSAAARLNLCTVPNGHCSEVIFASFEELTNRATDMFGAAATIATVYDATLTLRASTCLAAVSGDIQDVITQTAASFDTCLVTAQIKTAIAPSVKALQTAITGITIDPTLDTSGALTVLKQLGTDLLTPITGLFTAIQTALTAPCCDPTAVLTPVQTALTAAQAAITTAQTTVQPLQAVVKASTYTSLTSGLQAMLDAITASTTSFTNFQMLLVQVASASPPYTASTVTKVITADVAAAVAAPLKALVSGISSVSAVVTTVNKDVTTAVSIVAKTNTAINKGVAALVKPWTAFTKAVNDAIASIAKTSASSISSITSSYNAVLTKSTMYNMGDMTLLNTFLAAFPGLSQTTLTTVQTGAAGVLMATLTALTDQEALITPAITTAVNTMITTASTSQSSFAATCLNKYSTVLQGNTVAMSLLGGCVTPETSSVSMMVSTVSAELASIVSASNAAAVKLNLCTVANGQCSVAVFMAFTDLGTRIMDMFGAAGTIATVFDATQTLRVSTCLAAVSADIQDVVAQAQASFTTCLTTGK